MKKETPDNNQALLTEISRRLQQTEDRAASLVNGLESRQKIQDSIDNANKELHETCAAVINLSLDVKRAIEVFVGAVLALKEITAMLQETDSAAIHEKLDLIRQENKRIGDGQESIRKNIDVAAGRVSDQQKADSAIHNEKLDLTAQNIKRISNGQELIRSNIDAATEKVVASLKPRTVWEGIFGRRKDWS